MPRPPKPRRLRLLHGKKDHRSEPQPEKKLEVPPCPRYLKGYARHFWRTVGGEAVAMGVLTSADLMALEIGAAAYKERRDALDVIEREGLTYTTTTTQGCEMVRPRPEVAIAADAYRRVLMVLREFGCAPVSRLRLDVKTAETESFADFVASREERYDDRRRAAPLPPSGDEPGD